MTQRFHVGDRVRIPLGKSSLTGTVIEDRGAIGVRGRYIYRVLVPMDPYDPETYEIPGEEMEVVIESASVDDSTMKTRVLQYLKDGGLIAML
jgi:hypothetical protein